MRLDLIPWNKTLNIKIAFNAFGIEALHQNEYLDICLRKLLHLNSIQYQINVKTRPKAKSARMVKLLGLILNYFNRLHTRVG